MARGRKYRDNKGRDDSAISVVASPAKSSSVCLRAEIAKQLEEGKKAKRYMRAGGPETHHR